MWKRIVLAFLYCFVMFTESLKKLGFTHREALVYQTLLQTGPSPVGCLAKRANMKRVTVYPVLDSLLQRGLVSFEQTGKGKRYFPHDPECLLYYLEEQAAEIKFRIGIAKNCILELSESSPLESKAWQRIQYFQGFKPVLSALSELIHEKTPLCLVFMNFAKFNRVAQCLEAFLQLKPMALGILCVPECFRECAKLTYPTFKCSGLQSSSLVAGDLLIQGDLVFFLCSKDQDVQMILVNDSLYAAYVREILLHPHLDP